MQAICSDKAMRGLLYGYEQDAQATATALRCGAAIGGIYRWLGPSTQRRTSRYGDCRRAQRVAEDSGSGNRNGSRVVVPDSQVPHLALHRRDVARIVARARSARAAGQPLWRWWYDRGLRMLDG